MNAAAILCHLNLWRMRTIPRVLHCLARAAPDDARVHGERIRSTRCGNAMLADFRLRCDTREPHTLPQRSRMLRARIAPRYGLATSAIDCGFFARARQDILVHNCLHTALKGIKTYHGHGI